jgi:hypothetical protein
MIYTITIILSILVGINFLLLVFSTNKIKKTNKPKRAQINRPTIATKPTRTLTSPQVASPLSPTGS